MYLGKKELHNPAEYERDRANIISDKRSAVWLAFFELDGLINKSQLAEQYFKKSQSWLSQRLNGCISHNRKQEFTESEYRQLSKAFRDIAHRLEAHANEIDAASIDPAD